MGIQSVSRKWLLKTDAEVFVYFTWAMSLGLDLGFMDSA